MERDNIYVISSGGIGFLGLLTILFIYLKLTDKIGWRWIWVLSPLWGGFLFLVMISLIILLIVLIMEFYN